jgi:CDP-diacylglycerol--glycerol-3-phosphate 3-phosphatidyltransferase
MITISRKDLSVPNIMTCLRMLMAIAAGILFQRGQHVSFAAMLCIAASVLDYFDGWYARRYRQSTKLGAHLDPFADKVLIAVVFIALCFAVRWPWFSFLVAMILLREASITVYRMVILRRSGRFVPASRLGKIKTTVQCIVGDTLLFYVFIYPQSVPESATAIFPALLATFFITVDSGLRYVLPSCSDGKKRSALERLYQLIFSVRAREM